MSGLNNCTTCGRKPDICKHSFNRYSREWNHYAMCGCFKHVSASGGNVWSAEVAADMWNRANPEREMTDVNLNEIADQLAKAGIGIQIEREGFSFNAKESVMHANRELVSIALVNGVDLNEFYRNRLEGVKA